MNKVERIATVGDLPTDNLQFFQNRLPALESGDYSMAVRQSISSKDGKIPEQAYENVHKFVVQGPRFTLPGELLTDNAMYPPPDASGEYSNVLPHICFTRDTLPWERSAGSPAGVAEATLKDTTPWIGLLLVAETDSPQPVYTTSDTGHVTILDLLSVNYKTPDGIPGKLPANILFPEFPGPDHNELDYGQNWTDATNHLDINLDLFNQLAPSYADLAWLSHVRRITPGLGHSERYLQRLQAASTSTEPPSLSAVVANRLPVEGGYSRVYVVSWENYAPYLPGNNGEKSPAISDPKIDTVRLVVLFSWRFYAVPLKETFEGYLMGLNANDTPGLGGFLKLSSTGDTTEAGKAVDNAFAMGYVPLNHHTRQGAETVSWYRGPFVPFDSNGSINIPVLGPDSVTDYNPDLGMFNVSYAAAWQLGRLLALQNKSFAETLYNWRRTNISSTISAFEAEMIQRTLLEIFEGEEPPGDTLDQSLKGLVARVLRQSITEFVARKES